MTFHNEYEKVLNSVDLPFDFRLKLMATEGRPQTEFLSSVLAEFKTSKQLADMKISQRYYFNENDIQQRERFYIDRQGQPVSSKLLSNSRLPHAFLRKLTNQKINYLLAKDFIFRSSDNPEFIRELDNYFDADFKVTLNNLGDSAIKNGIGWLQVYYDANGKLKFKLIPSDEVIPFWKTSEHKELDAIVRFYKQEQYDLKGQKKYIEVVEYYDEKGVWIYKSTLNTPTGLWLESGPNPHFYANYFDTETNEDKKVGVRWNKIPFIPFKYNKEEKCLLTWIKELIDDYDKITSDNSNNIIDIPNSIKVVSGFEGDDKEEFTRNLAHFRTVFVGEGGDVKLLSVPLYIKDTDYHLERLRKDIYEFGGGVDTVNKELRDVSGVALRFQYADLDMDCSQMELQFRWAIYHLIENFIKPDLYNKGMDYMNAKYQLIFNTDIMLNETETINNLVLSKGIVSDQTLISNHPFVNDVQKELELIEAQKQKELDMQLELEKAKKSITKPQQNST